jgi:hypothetical protein
MNSLLKSLLTWMCFAGTTFFAAGAVADLGAGDDAIGDAGDAGDAGAGESDSGDSAGLLSDDVQDEAGATGDAAKTVADGRTLPKEVQAALKALKEAHPEHAKALEELRKSFFSSKQHGEFFKTPAEARQAKATLDLLGGAEGISDLQTKVAAVEAIDSSLAEGDPQVISDIATDFPDGFKKLAGPYFDKLQQMDPAAAAKVLQPHAFALMEHAGLGPVLSAIEQAITANDLPKAKDLLGKSLAWYDGQKQQAGTRQKTDDPDRVKFDNERKQFAETKEKTFREDIGRQTMSNQRNEVNKALVPYLKSKALGTDAKADLVDGIDREIQRLLKADGTYQAQVKALLTGKTRDSGKIVQYINAAVNEAAKKATGAVWTRRGYGSGAVARRPAAAATNTDKTVNAGATQSGPIKIAAKPNRADVDWSKTKDILFITNKAFMKTGPYKGKLVTWK